MRSVAVGYQYSEILYLIMYVYLCGGSAIEDVTTHLKRYLYQYSRMQIYSANTILRAICELTTENTT